MLDRYIYIVSNSVYLLLVCRCRTWSGRSTSWRRTSTTCPPGRISAGSRTSSPSSAAPCSTPRWAADQSQRGSGSRDHNTPLWLAQHYLLLLARRNHSYISQKQLISELARWAVIGGDLDNTEPWLVRCPASKQEELKKEFRRRKEKMSEHDWVSKLLLGEDWGCDLTLEIYFNGGNVNLKHKSIHRNK